MAAPKSVFLIFRRNIHPRWAKRPNLVATSNIVRKTAADEDTTLITKFQERKDLFEHVKPIIPYKRIPEPPTFESPTPSGWVGPTGQFKDPYYVGRSKNHMLAVYVEQGPANRKYTKINKIEGDIWQLEGDLKNHLKDTIPGHIYTQVNEITRCIRIKGAHTESVAEFLLQKGY